MQLSPSTVDSIVSQSIGSRLTWTSIREWLKRLLLVHHHEVPVQTTPKTVDSPAVDGEAVSPIPSKACVPASPDFHRIQC